MPLNATDFVPKGPIRSADLMQFVNLFTGVMLDQPITFRNSVIIGGNNPPTTAALSLYGAANQTGNLLNLYPTAASQNPTFGFAALGAFGWGPGGALVQDTFLSRIGTQNGHTTDTSGILIIPHLEVQGSVSAASYAFPGGSSLMEITSPTLLLQAAPNLQVQFQLFFGTAQDAWMRRTTAGDVALDIEPTLLVHGANAPLYGLTYADAHLQVRANDLPDTSGTFSMGTSLVCSASNWLQFNPKFYKVTTGVGWPGTALLLDYDVDNANAAGGRISMMGGRIGIGGLVGGGGALLQVLGDESVSTNLSVGGFITSGDYISTNTSVRAGSFIAAGPVVSGTAGDLSANRGNTTGYVFLGNTGNHYVGFDGSNYQMPNGGLGVTGNVQAATFNGQVLPINIPATATIRSGAGIFVGSNVGPGQGAQVNVTFSSPFPGVPSIQITQVQGGSDKPFFTLQVEGPSASGFVAHCQNLSNNQSSNCVIDYIAVYGTQ